MTTTAEIHRFRRTLIEIEGACAADVLAMSPALRTEAVAGLMRHLSPRERIDLLQPLLDAARTQLPPCSEERDR